MLDENDSTTTTEAAPETTGYFGHGIVGSRGHFDGGGFDRSGGHDFRPAPRKYHDSSRATSGQLVVMTRQVVQPADG